MPAVSIIVPVYKVEDSIARSVRSILSQSLEDMEFIFVDDCSPDRSMDILAEVLEEFSERRQQVILHRMPRNSGQAAVRTAALAIAGGEYIAHCDSDDCLAPDACEKMYLKAREENLDIVYCDFLTGNDSLGWKLKNQKSAPGEEVRDLLGGRVMGNLWSRLIRSSLLKSAPAPLADYCEDLVLVLYATLKASSIGHLPQPFYHYYYREDSISHTPGKEALLGRTEALKSNAALMLDILRKDGRYKENSADVIFFKYRCRQDLKPFVHQRDILRVWKNTFPEINRRFLFTPGIKAEEKFFFILIYLHLFRPWKMMTGKIRGRI
ncbi:MAG: glycosyltransferase family 2 protein [Bacteroidales bacterium]|nr:glycosyltransferase family 2 protein [Bacteroidales bacterium]